MFRLINLFKRNKNIYNENGPCQEYYEEGKGSIHQTYFLRNGIKDGDHVSYYDNGIVESITPYKLGSIHGVRVTYNEDGSKKSETVYKDGEKHGISLDYSKNDISYNFYYRNFRIPNNKERFELFFPFIELIQDFLIFELKLTKKVSPNNLISLTNQDISELVKEINSEIKLKKDNLSLYLKYKRNFILREYLVSKKNNITTLNTEFITHLEEFYVFFTDWFIMSDRELFELKLQHRLTKSTKRRENHTNFIWTFLPYSIFFNYYVKLESDDNVFESFLIQLESFNSKLFGKNLVLYQKVQDILNQEIDSSDNPGLVGRKVILDERLTKIDEILES